jgi:transposase
MMIPSLRVPLPARGSGGDPMYDRLARHVVQVLRQAHVPTKEIMRITRMSRRSVQRISSKSAPGPACEGPGAMVRSVGRPSVVAPFLPKIDAILAAEPELPTVEILHRLRQQGYASQKSAVYAAVAERRPPAKSEPMVRFEGVPGEFSQHDFGNVRIAYLDGGKEIVHFYASRLKYSRWSHVRLVPNEQAESLVRAHLEGLDEFGGVPLVCVFDRPKTVVLRQEGEHIEWNPIFGQLAVDTRFAPELCAPRRANQKGTVENLVKWVKGSFFKVRRFQDREDMERQLAEWLHEVNHVRPSRATGVPPLTRIEEERKRLRPLPCRASEYALRIPVTVGPTGMVEYRAIRYSMPPDSIGMPGTLFLYPHRVRIVARHHLAEHPRVPVIGDVSYVPAHRAELVAKVSGKRGKLYLQRQQLLELGAPALDFLTELVHQRPRTWGEDVRQLHDRLLDVGAERMIGALECACNRRLFGAEYVASLLGRDGGQLELFTIPQQASVPGPSGGVGDGAGGVGGGGGWGGGWGGPPPQNGSRGRGARL